VNGTVYISRRYLFVVSSMTLSAISDYRPAEPTARTAANKKLENIKCGGKKAVVA
jgi:hypothetical protein